MQLSLPAASFPTPAAAPNCTGKNPTSSTDTKDTSADSFDSLLKKDSPGDDSKDDKSKTSTDAEQAAGILAALLWMQNPAAATKVPVMPAVPSDGTAAAETTDVAGLTDGSDATIGTAQAGTPFFGAMNSRAFGKAQASGVQAPVTAFAGVVADQIPGDAVEGQGGSPANPGLVAGQTTKCAADAKLPAGAGVAVPAGENSLNAEVVTAQVATVVPGAAKLAVTTTGKIPIKNGAEVKALGATATDENSDSTVDDSVSALSSTGEKTIVPTLAAGSKADQAQATSPVADPSEKIAPLPAVLKDLEKSAAKVVEKYFLEPVQKAVTSAASSVGIAVAKVNAVMSSAPSARTKSASLVEPLAAFVFSGEAAPTATLTVDAPAPTATVRETLAAVISAVDAIERRADVQQKSVDLNFHVGNEKLGVRVELKDGSVHATFRAESPELTSALSREWHSVVPTAFAREVRLAEPVFHTVATQGSNSSFTSLGQGASQQQREQPKAAPTFASALREFNDSPVQETAAPAVSSATNSSQLLNAIA